MSDGRSLPRFQARRQPTEQLVDVRRRAARAMEGEGEGAVWWNP